MDSSATELHPYLFRLRKTNIALNSLEDKIMAYNLAIGDSHRVVELREPMDKYRLYKTLGVTTISKGRIICHVQQIPLESIVDRFDGVHLVKFNCERCEYPSILSLSQKSLKKINFLVLHLHEYAPHIRHALANKLRESGFRLLAKADPDILVYADTLWQNHRTD